MAEDGEGTHERNIDVLLHTEQTFPPPPDFAAEANASDPDMRAHSATTVVAALLLAAPLGRPAAQDSTRAARDT